MQLPVTVPGIGLAEVAREASPSAWFKMVTQGNLDRFMPPFVGALNDQQRWDVVSYVLTLHTAPKQVAEGKQLFEVDCPLCSAKFTDQALHQYVAAMLAEYFESNRFARLAMRARSSYRWEAIYRQHIEPLLVLSGASRNTP